MRALPKSAVERAPRTLKGTSEQVILVRLPVPGVFREAVFFLHEDYLRRGNLSREALLLQAREAAEDYVEPLCAQREARIWWPYPLCVLLGAALGLVLGLML